jgi:hypothetical protein
MAKLGTKVSARSTVKGAPPVIFTVQPTSYIKLTKPEQLKQWEKDLQDFYGIKNTFGNMAGSGTESCSCGCSDDSDMC